MILLELQSPSDWQARHCDFFAPAPARRAARARPSPHAVTQRARMSECTTSSTRLAVHVRT